jgi:hypothetical protein
MESECNKNDAKFAPFDARAPTRPTLTSCFHSHLACFTLCGLSAGSYSDRFAGKALLACRFSGSDFPYNGRLDRSVRSGKELKMSPTPEGRIDFWLKPEHDFDWYSNSLAYTLPPVNEGGIEVKSVKNSDRTIRLSVKGLPADVIELTAPVPYCTSQGLFVSIAWLPTRITLFLNGKEAKHLDISP